MQNAGGNVGWLTPESWLTVTLSAVTVALAVLAIVVALASIWGYSNIVKEARRVAAESAKAKLSEYLDSEQIQAKLKKEIEARMETEANRLFADLSMAFAYPEKKDGDGGENAIGKEYPGGEV